MPAKRYSENNRNSTFDFEPKNKISTGNSCKTQIPQVLNTGIGTPILIDEQTIYSIFYGNTPEKHINFNDL